MYTTSNKGKHLTLEERRIILKGIESGADKTAIANTIGKEIKKHRVLTSKCHLPLECSNYAHCKHGCANYSKCRFDKYRYVPEQADLLNFGISEVCVAVTLGTNQIPYISSGI